MGKVLVVRVYGPLDRSADHMTHPVLSEQWFNVETIEDCEQVVFFMIPHEAHGYGVKIMDTGRSEGVNSTKV